MLRDAKFTLTGKLGEISPSFRPALVVTNNIRLKIMKFGRLGEISPSWKHNSK